MKQFLFLLLFIITSILIYWLYNQHLINLQCSCY